MELADWHRWWKERGGLGIRRFLVDEWDPIGVGHMPDAADEYDAYVGVVGRMLHEGRTEAEIVVYLRDVRLGHIGLSPDATADEAERRVAKRMVEWYAREMLTAADR